MFRGRAPKARSPRLQVAAQPPGYSLSSSAVQSPPNIQYTQSEDGTSIAYTVVGESPIDLLCIPGFVSHLDVLWEAPNADAYFGRLASFSRLIMFDKRGQGLSDRPPTPPTLEQSAADARAVLDAAGSKRA